MRAKFLALICVASLSLAACGGEGAPPDDAARRVAEEADADWQAAEQNILGPGLERAPDVGVDSGNEEFAEPANSAEGNSLQDPPPRSSSN